MYTGEDLKNFRESRGWSLRHFATVIGVSVKTIQVIEKQNKVVPLQMRLALSAIEAGAHPIEVK